MASRSCLKCKQLCDKPLQLPECGHLFCKRCLSEYFSTLSSWTDEPDYFSCPHCGGKVSKPDLPIAKWTKVFKVNNTATFFTKDSNEMLEQQEKERESSSVQPFSPLKRTNASRKLKGSTFYTNDSHEQSNQEYSSKVNDSKLYANDSGDQVKQEESSKVNGSKFYTKDSSEETKYVEKDTGKDIVTISETSSGKSVSLRRIARSLSRYPSIEIGFETKISTDERDCLYFGGDVMPNGDIILCDWLNFSVKMFGPSGQFICKFKLDEAPLDVTAVRNDMIVVSFGTRSKMVLFLTYVASSKVLDLLGCNKLPGFLYSTAMHDGACLGIFEKDGCKQASVVQVTVDRTGAKSGASRRTVTDYITPDKNVELSSESGIFYDHTDRRLYITSRRKLLCFRKDRLVFRQSFQRTPTEMFILGSVTCDEKGVVYVASDQCILRVAKDGNLLSVVPVPTEPYHIITGKDKRKLALIGKQNEVMYYSIKKDLNIYSLTCWS